MILEESLALACSSPYSQKILKLEKRSPCRSSAPEVFTRTDSGLRGVKVTCLPPELTLGGVIRIRSTEGSTEVLLRSEAGPSAPLSRCINTCSSPRLPVPLPLRHVESGRNLGGEMKVM